MNMSDNFTKNDFGWNRFAATGSIFDYLNYKHIDAMRSGKLDDKVAYNKGDSHEDRGKRGSH